MKDETEAKSSPRTWLISVTDGLTQRLETLSAINLFKTTWTREGGWQTTSRTTARRHSPEIPFLIRHRQKVKREREGPCNECKQKHRRGRRVRRKGRHFLFHSFFLCVSLLHSFCCRRVAQLVPSVDGFAQTTVSLDFSSSSFEKSRPLFSALVRSSK